MFNNNSLIKMKKAVSALMLLAIFLLPASFAFALPADVTNISGKDYYPAARKAIQEAQKSVSMVMYQVSLRSYGKGSQVHNLVSELINAHERGVDVEVILDQNVDFAGRRNIDEWMAEGKNAFCFKVLKEAGIDVHYDNLATYTHAKAIVIDNEIVIMGSSNWSESAFSKNAEVNLLVKSEDLAREILEYFKTIKTDDKATDVVPIQQGGVPVSWRFLENPKLAGRMLTKHAERAFDIYLFLLRELDGDSEGKITLDYDKVAACLGLSDKMTRTGYRRQITKSLRELEKTYNLIKFEPEFAKDATVMLLSYEEPAGPYAVPEEWYFQIPDDFWGYGWNNNLSMRAKFCYLINLAYVGISNNNPWWFSSRDVLSERFNISKWVISKGMGELRSLNLIDVSYDTPKDGKYENMLAKSYKVLSLYDPEWLETEWDRLEVAYGSKELKKARKYAKIVFKENDPQVAEDILATIKAVGEGPIKKAFNIVAKKSIDNSKRCYAYVKGILANMQEQLII
ncbi:MAG: phospholipase D-like domain-containing protein [Candidatus Omnitrophota bacterium]